jgi:SAM-dependent methyltransferase
LILHVPQRFAYYSLSLEPGDLFGAAIPFNHCPLLVCYENPFGCMLDKTAEAILTFLQSFFRLLALGDVAIIDDDCFNTGFVEQVGDYRLNPAPRAVVSSQTERTMLADFRLSEKLGIALLGPLQIIRMHQLEDVMPRKFVRCVAQRADDGRAFPKQSTIAERQNLFAAGDALALPFQTERFDGLINGFLLRNLVDLPRGLAEMRRVVRPGGRVVCLEITRPRTPIFREFFHVYFYRLVPLIGGIVAGDLQAYRYLPNSLTHFPMAEALKMLMLEAGFRDVRYRLLAMGTVALHVATV